VDIFTKDSFTLKDCFVWEKQFVAHKLYCLQKNSSVFIQDTRGNVCARKISASAATNHHNNVDTTGWNPLIKRIQHLHIDTEENILIIRTNHQLSGRSEHTKEYFTSRQLTQLLFQYYKHGVCIGEDMKDSANQSTLRPRLDVSFSASTANTTQQGTQKNLLNVCKFGDFYLFLESLHSPSNVTSNDPSKGKTHDSVSLKDPVLSTILSHPEIGAKSSFGHILPGGKGTLLEALHVPPAVENPSLETLLINSKANNSTTVTLDDISSASSLNRVNEDTMKIPTITASPRQPEISTVDSLFNLSKLALSSSVRSEPNTAASKATELSIEVYLPEEVNSEDLEGQHQQNQRLRYIETVKVDIANIAGSQFSSSTNFDMVSEYTMNHREGSIILGSSQTNKLILLHIECNYKRSNTIESSQSASSVVTYAAQYFKIRRADTLTLPEQVKFIRRYDLTSVKKYGFCLEWMQRNQIICFSKDFTRKS
jgi:hypothetical protein